MKKKDNINHYTAQELLEKYPQAYTEFGWTPSKIGIFFYGKLLQGCYNRAERRTLITEESFVRLLNWATGNSMNNGTFV